MFFRIIQVISSLLIAAAVNAHPGHGDVVQLDQSSAIETASGKIEDLIGEGKLDSSWLEERRPKRSLPGFLVVKIGLLRMLEVRVISV